MVESTALLPVNNQLIFETKLGPDFVEAPVSEVIADAFRKHGHELAALGIQSLSYATKQDGNSREIAPGSTQVWIETSQNDERETAIYTLFYKIAEELSTPPAGEEFGFGAYQFNGAKIKTGIDGKLRASPALAPAA